MSLSILVSTVDCNLEFVENFNSLNRTYIASRLLGFRKDLSLRNAESLTKRNAEKNKTRVILLAKATFQLLALITSYSDCIMTLFTVPREDEG